MWFVEVALRDDVTVAVVRGNISMLPDAEIERPVIHYCPIQNAEGSTGQLYTGIAAVY